MNDSQESDHQMPPCDGVAFAQLGQGVYVFRVIGRANHTITPDLRKTVISIADHQALLPEKYSFLFDMERVETMDSTFMGALASVALRHKKDTGKQLVLCNLNEHCLGLLNTLGLRHFVDLRKKQADEHCRQQWQIADRANLSKAQITAMMLEAHETLCEVESGNRAQFDGVLSFLRKSLEQQGGTP